MANRMTMLAVLACTAAVAVVSIRVSTHLNVAGEPAVPRYALQDFRDAVYYPAKAFLDGRNPYDQPRYAAAYPVADGLALYSPLTLLLHAPFALLPYRVAELVYYASAVGLTIALGAIALVLCGVQPTVGRVAALGAALVASRPGHWNLFNGQVTLQAVIPMVVALWCARDRPLVAGVALALTTFKPTYGLPLAALLLLWGAWRSVLFGAAIAVLLTALPLARVVGAAGGVTPFVTSIEASYAARAGERRKQPEHSPFRVDVIALAGRILRRPPGNGETVVLTLGTLGLAALGLRRIARRARAVAARGTDIHVDAHDRDARIHAVSLASLGIVACAYHQQYDLPVLALPLVALIWGSGAWPWRSHPGLRRFALALVVVPLVNYAGSETGSAILGMSPARLLLASSVDNVALLGLIAIYVTAAAPVHPGNARGHDRIA